MDLVTEDSVDACQSLTLAYHELLMIYPFLIIGKKKSYKNAFTKTIHLALHAD